MSDRVRRVLLERILDGVYPPGHRLVELQLARELNTSQGPVREALRELEAAHLVQTEPYRGTYVRAVGEREMREACQVRSVLEELAGQLATPFLQHQSAELEKELEEIRAAALAGDRDGYARHDLAFHRLIVEASRNQILLRVWDSLAFEIRTRVFTALQSTDLGQFSPYHDEVIEAVRSGNCEKAGQLLRRHSEQLCPSFEAASGEDSPLLTAADSEIVVAG